MSELEAWNTSPQVRPAAAAGMGMSYSVDVSLVPWRTVEVFTPWVLALVLMLWTFRMLGTAYPGAAVLVVVGAATERVAERRARVAVVNFILIEGFKTDDDDSEVVWLEVS